MHRAIPEDVAHERRKHRHVRHRGGGRESEARRARRRTPSRPRRAAAAARRPPSRSTRGARGPRSPRLHAQEHGVRRPEDHSRDDDEVALVEAQLREDRGIARVRIASTPRSETATPSACKRVIVSRYTSQPMTMIMMGTELLRITPLSRWLLQSRVGNMLWSPVPQEPEHATSLQRLRIAGHWSRTWATRREASARAPPPSG